MERCVVERTVPDVSNDLSAFVLKLQQSNRAGKMLCVIWVWLMRVSDTFFIAGLRRWWHSGYSKRR
jgi:hypothetical protein